MITLDRQRELHDVAFDLTYPTNPTDSGINFLGLASEIPDEKHSTIDPRITDILGRINQDEMLSLSSQLHVGICSKYYHAENAGFCAPKPGKSVCGDKLTFERNGFIQLDGINPVNLEPKTRQSWPVPPDFFASTVVGMALSQVLAQRSKSLRGAPDPDSFLDLLVPLISQNAGKYRHIYGIKPALLQQPPSTVGAMIIDGSEYGRESRAWFIGDGTGSFVLEDGTIIPIVSSAKDKMQQLLPEIDLLYATLVANSTTPWVVQSFIADSFRDRAVNGVKANGGRRLRKLTASISADTIEHDIDRDSFSEVSVLVPDNAVAAFFASDGCGLADYVPFFSLYDFMKDKHCRSYQDEKNQYAQLLSLNRQVNMAAAENGRYERENGPADDDFSVGFYVLHRYRDSRQRERLNHALSRAFARSQRILLDDMAKFKLIPGDKKHLLATGATLKEKIAGIGISDPEESDYILAQILLLRLKTLLR